MATSVSEKYLILSVSFWGWQYKNETENNSRYSVINKKKIRIGPPTQQKGNRNLTIVFGLIRKWYNRIEVYASIFFFISHSVI